MVFLESVSCFTLLKVCSIFDGFVKEPIDEEMMLSSVSNWESFLIPYLSLISLMYFSLNSFKYFYFAIRSYHYVSIHHDNIFIPCIIKSFSSYSTRTLKETGNLHRLLSKLSDTSLDST